MALKAAKSPHPHRPWLGRLQPVGGIGEQGIPGTTLRLASKGLARFYDRECTMNNEVVPPLAANMNAAFKKVNGAMGVSDSAIRDMILSRIVELAKDGVYDIEELSSRTLMSLAPER
jgi:hypothetical protein